MRSASVRTFAPDAECGEIFVDASLELVEQNLELDPLEILHLPDRHRIHDHRAVRAHQIERLACQASALAL